MCLAFPRRALCTPPRRAVRTSLSRDTCVPRPPPPPCLPPSLPLSLAREPYNYSGSVIDADALVGTPFESGGGTKDRHGSFFTFRGQTYFACNDQSHGGSGSFRSTIIVCVTSSAREGARGTGRRCRCRRLGAVVRRRRGRSSSSRPTRRPFVLLPLASEPRREPHRARLPRFRVCSSAASSLARYTARWS